MIDEYLTHRVVLYTLFQPLHACYAYKNNRIIWIMQKHYVNKSIISASIEYLTNKVASKQVDDIQF